MSPASDLTVSLFVVCAVVLGVLGVITLGAGAVALRRSRPMRFALRTLTGLLLLSLGGLVGAVGVGIRGFRALTREDVAARLTVRPTGRQRFAVVVHYADGREGSFDVAGDEIYVDAHILKWKPFANLVGLHTAYELDRLTGRYRGIEDERSAVRTVYALSEPGPVDLFSLRQRYAFLSVLLDAEYGSATFVTVNRPMELEVRVSTTGLLMREAPAAAR